MRRWTCVLIFLIAAPLMAEESRAGDAVYTATLVDLPKDAHELKVWIPLPVSRAGRYLYAEADCQTAGTVASKSELQGRRRR